LRILSRVMQPTTLDLLRRAGIRPGMAVLEVACGGGDLAFDLAGMVSPGGRVVATDIDKIKLELAGHEADERQLRISNSALRTLQRMCPNGNSILCTPGSS
jgi:ubiquinone/menaquinone biosynthesis C-methylase UbiE